MPIFKAAFLFRLAPENFVVAVRVERWVDIDQIDAPVRQFLQLIDVIAAINDARVDHRGRLGRHYRIFDNEPEMVNHPSVFALAFISCGNRQRARKRVAVAYERSRQFETTCDLQVMRVVRGERKEAIHVKKGPRHSQFSLV